MEQLEKSISEGSHYEIHSQKEYDDLRKELLGDASRGPLPITFKGEGPELAEGRAVAYYNNRSEHAVAMADALKNYREKHPEEFKETNG